MDRPSPSAWMTGPRARGGVFFASVLESTVVPIPLELLLLPAMAFKRQQIWSMATAALLGCLIGAGFWYGLGAFFFETVAKEILGWLGLSDSIPQYRARIEDNAFWIVFAGGVTPAPFQIVTCLAGVVRYQLLAFALACASSRAIRYFGLAGLVALMGDRARDWWEEHRIVLFLASVVLLAALYGLTRLARDWLLGNGG